MSLFVYIYIVACFILSCVMTWNNMNNLHASMSGWLVHISLIDVFLFQAGWGSYTRRLDCLWCRYTDSSQWSWGRTVWLSILWHWHRKLVFVSILMKLHIEKLQITKRKLIPCYWVTGREVVSLLVCYDIKDSKRASQLGLSIMWLENVVICHKAF